MPGLTLVGVHAGLGFTMAGLHTSAHYDLVPAVQIWGSTTGAGESPVTLGGTIELQGSYWRARTAVYTFENLFGRGSGTLDLVAGTHATQVRFGVGPAVALRSTHLDGGDVDVGGLFVEPGARGRLAIDAPLGKHAVFQWHLGVTSRASGLDYDTGVGLGVAAVIRSVGLFLATSGCTTLATLDGARTLAPKQTQWTVAGSLQRGANPLSGSVIPLPQVELGYRRGLAPDVDFGVRVYLLGLGHDLRYRFLHEGPLHVAVQPGLFLFFLPLGGAAGQGSIEVRAPVTAELELSDHWSVASGGRVFLREQWNSTTLEEESGVGTRLDSYLGGAGRLEYHTPRFAFGFGVDLYGQQARAAGLAWSAGIDFQFRSESEEGDVLLPQRH